MNGLLRTLIAVVLVTGVAACGPLSDLARAGHMPAGTMTLHGSTRVPMLLSGNHVFLKAKVDGVPYAFVFDSGGVAIVTPAVSRAAGCKTIGQAHVVGAGDRSSDVKLVRVPELRIGSAVYARGTFLAMDLPFPTKSPLHGLPFGGIVGAEFLASSVVTLDYAGATITFTEPAAYRADRLAMALPLTLRAGHPNVRASVDGKEGGFDVDTGNETTVTLAPGFASSSGLEKALRGQMDSVIGRGVGGIIMGKAARAANLRLGSQIVNKPVVMIARVTGGIYADPNLAGAIGGGVLRRFTATLDVPHATLYLRPNASFAKPFVFNRAGLFTQRDGAAESVQVVDSGGPARAAGILTGDRIMSIAGRAVSQVSPSDIKARWQDPVGTRIRLTLLRAGKTVHTTIVLRDLI